MTEEIDISRLHGTIKQYALSADKDKKGSKGNGKLNTQYELKLFKEMVIRNGKQAELLKQIPNVKGITVPKDISSKKSEENVNKRIISLMKEQDSRENIIALKDAVSEKLNRD